MIIDNDNLVILIEVPKTGTTYIRTCLKYWADEKKDDRVYVSKKMNERHAKLSEIFKDPMLKHTPKDYDVFMFVRHPEDFFVSEFFEYRDNHIIPYLNKEKMFKNPTELVKLHGEFVYSRYKYFKKEDAFDLNKNLNTVLCDDGYQCFPKHFVNIKSIYNHYLDVDVLEDKLHICKYEDFKDSIEKFFRSIKKPIPNIEMKINVSKKDQKINRENRMLINEIFDGDFKKYDYYKRNIYSCES